MTDEFLERLDGLDPASEPAVRATDEADDDALDPQVAEATTDSLAIRPVPADPETAASDSVIADHVTGSLPLAADADTRRAADLVPAAQEPAAQEPAPPGPAALEPALIEPTLLDTPAWEPAAYADPAYAADDHGAHGLNGYGSNGYDYAGLQAAGGLEAVADLDSVAGLEPGADPDPVVDPRDARLDGGLAGLLFRPEDEPEPVPSRVPVAELIRRRPVSLLLAPAVVIVAVAVMLTAGLGGGGPAVNGAPAASLGNQLANRGPVVLPRISSSAPVSVGVVGVRGTATSPGETPSPIVTFRPSPPIATATATVSPNPTVVPTATAVVPQPTGTVPPAPNPTCTPPLIYQWLNIPYC